MLTVKKKQYLTNQSGQRVGVLLDMKTFEKMQDELDDYYCRGHTTRQSHRPMRRSSGVSLLHWAIYLPMCVHENNPVK